QMAGDNGLVLRSVDGKGPAVEVVERLLLDVRKEERRPAVSEAKAAVAVRALVNVGRWEGALGVMVAVHGQPELLQVVGALNAGCRRAHLLDGGYEQADEHGDDGDHHQQLDQREAVPRL